jgi:CRISPR/Cas system CSM-associated protein Csm3 (group 7 of RAMP superfamily)
MRLKFTVTFHGPFRVSTGQARIGVDSAVDRAALLPASSIKGIMRASAHRLLPDDIVDSVFGAPGTASAWAWTSGHFAEAPVVADRVRIALTNGVAAEGALLINEEVWASSCTFAIDQTDHIDEQSLAIHTDVLEFAARSTHFLGADRRRGLGSVTISGDTAVDVAQLAERILNLRSRAGNR